MGRANVNKRTLLDVLYRFAISATMMMIYLIITYYSVVAIFFRFYALAHAKSSVYLSMRYHKTHKQ